MLASLKLQLILLALSIAVATAAQFSYGSCETKGSQEHGLCIQIRDCPYLYELLNISQPTAAQRQQLKDSQCGIDNTHQGVTAVHRVLVCCPDSKRRSSPAAGNPIASRSGEQSEAANVLPSSGVCGVLFANRIIGGTKTQLWEFPWMALLQYKTSKNEVAFQCGGALINSRYVLTAGHCLASSKLDMGGWKLHGVRLGEWDVSTAPDCVIETNKKRTCAPMHIDIEVDKMIVNELYVPNSIDQVHDIALLRLKESVSYTEYVKPICLPVAEEMRSKNYEGFAMDVAGWGVTEDGQPSDTKLKITVDVWNLKKCQDKYRTYQRRVNNSQFCAGGKLSIDTCNGDSGGPLMIPTNDGQQEVFYAVGVTSYGPTPCGLQGWPGVYTRVGQYVDWILSKLEG